MSEPRRWSISDEYGWPIRFAIYQQLVIAILCLLLLDGGRTAKLCEIAMIGFWVGAALFIIRRPRTPTADDKTLISCGFVPLFAVTAVIALVMQR